ncbi:MAG: lysylphosphatidylglycerol synthase domain-containing protein [Actinomycetota bacterium]|nr:lysylphosphatidylglycerol synthase domain-containing protein [Actinomycetota bacterium]
MSIEVVPVGEAATEGQVAGLHLVDPDSGVVVATGRTGPFRSHVRLNSVRIASSAVVLVCVTAVLWANRGELPVVGQVLGGAQRGWLVGGVLLLGCWWVAWVLLHAASRRALGVGGYAETGRLIPVTLAAVALNLAVKSGGLAGLAAFAADARRRDLPRGPVSGAYLLAAAFADVGFIVTLAAAVTVTWMNAQLTRPEVAAVALFVVLLVMRVVVLGAALRSRDALRRMWTMPARLWDWLRRGPRRHPDTVTADELYEAVSLVRARPRLALPALGFAIGVDVVGAAMLWAALAAVGGGNRPAVALVAYAISGVFGVVGVLPGGVGFVELSAAAVLVCFGTPTAVAGAAVVLFRVWEFWLPLALGAPVAGWLRRQPHTGTARESTVRL